jgi:hypothetical protein
MNLPKLARISILCLLAFVTVLTASAHAAPRCGCDFCTQDPSRACNLDGQQTTCSYFLSVALCQPTSTNSPAAFLSVADGSPLMSENVQAPLGCMISGR